MKISWSQIAHELADLPSSVGKASRSLRRAPGFVAIATLSLGAALGLSTSVFALIDAMRHPASPYRAVDQLYLLQLRLGAGANPNRHDVDQALSSMTGVTAHASSRFATTLVEFGDGVQRTGVAYTHPGFVDILGVRPRIGRLPTAAESSGASVALVSDALWRSRFNNRGRTDGATVTVDNNQYTIIGVLPTRTELPGETSLGVNVWIPDTAPDTTRPQLTLVRIARGSADTVLVQSQLNALCKRWTQLFLSPNVRPFSSRLMSMRPNPLDLQDYHKAMIGAAVCVLLIACANVAALMLARGMVRRRDYALQLALGAARAEIAREVIVEVALLALVGCVAGALIASWAIGLITRATPVEMRWQGFVQPQWSLRVLAASALAVIAAIGVAGGFPAWQASRTDPMGPLKESSGGAIGRAGTRFRWLVMAELALSMTLVMGATLMLKSATRMAAYDFGYDARGLMLVESTVPFYDPGLHDNSTARSRDSLYSELLSRIKTIPGVRSASKFTTCVFSHGTNSGAITSDRTIEGGNAAYVLNHCNIGSAGLFTTLGIPMADGRDFIQGDDATGAVILDERTAHNLYPHERAVGRLLKLGDLASDRPWLPIVGVVRNQQLKFNAFPEAGPDTAAQVYATLGGVPVFADIVVRPVPGAKGVELEVWRALRATMPPRSYARVQPWIEGYLEGVRTEQFLSLLFMLLGAAGLFSVISYVAGQRNREFAVRIALGATKSNVLNLVMKEALVMALGGTAVGAGLGMWAGFLLWNKMWGVYPVDAQALIAGETTLLLVTMLACLLPALRATKANPVDVLRAA